MKGKKRFGELLIGIASVSLTFSSLAVAADKVVVIPLNSSSCTVPTVTSAGGQVWMDRNLGAFRVAESMDDYQAYGWFYQWGRLADGHELPNSTASSVQSSGDVPGNDYFIIGSTDWRSTPNSDLWQGVDGVNNPCPSGFRLPTKAEWEIETSSWASIDAANAFASPLKLVSAGYRHYTDGGIVGVGSGGHYWSSTTSLAEYSRSLDFDSTSGNFFSPTRGYGYNVRCIKD